MTEKEAAVRMEHVFRPSPLSLPVMFFGTLEIAWMAPAEVVSWAEGVEANFLKKNKARRKFLKSVEEVCSVLNTSSPVGPLSAFRFAGLQAKVMTSSVCFFVALSAGGFLITA